MRGIAGMAAVLVGGALLALPAGAGAKTIRLITHSTGGIVVSWHGDPATGCQTKGTCAYSGTYQLPLGGGGTDVSSGLRSGAPTVDLESQAPAVVRVAREAPGGPGICVDAVSEEGAEFSLRPGSDGLVHTGFAALAGMTGHCAGPVPSDLPRDFPTAAAQKLGTKPVTLDFSGRRAFASGGWAGEVSSNLKVTVSVGPGRRSPQRLPFAIRERIRRLIARRPLLQVLDFTYRLENLSAAMRGDFTGRPSPACDAIDACGAGGSATYSLTAGGDTVHIAGVRVLRRGPRRDMRSALRALRAGRFHFDGYSDLSSASARTSTSERLPDGSQCNDGIPAQPSSLTVTGRRGRVLFELGGEGDLTPELLRTRCPGPELTDVFGSGAVVRASLPRASVGRRTLRVFGESTGGFGAAGYVGRRGQAMSILLRRTHASLTIRRGASFE